jgi:membrane protease YdiL (CAAX protease family)
MSQPSYSAFSYPNGGLVRSFLAFLRHPAPGHGLVNPLPIRVILTHLFRLYAIEFLLLIPILMVIGAASQVSDDLDSHALQTLFEQLPVPVFILLAVVLAPFLEESLFRLPLCYSPLNLGVAGLGIMLLLPDLLLPARIAIGVVIFVVVLFLLLQRSQEVMAAHFYRHLRALVILSSVLFGLVHITNFEPQVWWLAPLLVLPQITLGFFLAYVRLQYGYLWAIFCHGFHNLLAISPMIMMQLGSENLRIQMIEQQEGVTLTPLDYGLISVLVGGMFLFFGLCLRSAYRSFREWKTGIHIT